MELVSYRVNSIEGTMYNVTLFFSGNTEYTVTINLPDVTDEASLSEALKEFAQQYIAGMTPHPLSSIVGQERAV